MPGACILPEQLVRELESATASRKEILSLLAGPFKTIELYGRDGLKARTGLFEYRYPLASSTPKG